MRVGLCDVCKNIDEQRQPAVQHLRGERRLPRGRPGFPIGFRAEWARERAATSPRSTGSPARACRASPSTRAGCTSTRPAACSCAAATPSSTTSTTTTAAASPSRQGRNGDEFGWLEVAHASDRWLDPNSEERDVALGAALTTDVLIAHAVAPQTTGFSHCLPEGTEAAELVATARRAAWTSLAFAFRTAAAASSTSSRPSSRRASASSATRARATLPGNLPRGRDRERRRLCLLPRQAGRVRRPARPRRSARRRLGRRTRLRHVLLRLPSRLRELELPPAARLEARRRRARHPPPRRARASTAGRRHACTPSKPPSQAFAPYWSCADLRPSVPVIETHGQRAVQVVHPLANRDAELRDPSAPRSLPTSST